MAIVVITVQISCKNNYYARKISRKIKKLLFYLEQAPQMHSYALTA